MANVKVFDIPIQSRSGRLVSPSFTIPQNMSGEIQFLGNIPTTDYENAANSIEVGLYQEGATGWRLRAGCLWRGGRYIEDGITNPQPVFFSLTVSDSERGKVFRVEANIPVPMDAGFSVSRMER